MCFIIAMNFRRKGNERGFVLFIIYAILSFLFHTANKAYDLPSFYSSIVVIIGIGILYRIQKVTK
ncbi:hypothetical protein [Anaeromicrobium sp.]|uniref:hypothetical protein n=1 Tax=Anaeromicrobium sp. TaxID=1929132 RepID=UPI0026013AE3|nr:hypothetical protein [Anaeromicrobium sp.]